MSKGSRTWQMFTDWGNMEKMKKRNFTPVCTYFNNALLYFISSWHCSVCIRKLEFILCPRLTNKWPVIFSVHEAQNIKQENDSTIQSTYFMGRNAMSWTKPIEQDQISMYKYYIKMLIFSHDCNFWVINKCTNCGVTKRKHVSI